MKLFGTDGLRGHAGQFPLDDGTVRQIGRELGRRLAASGNPTVVVGGDTRESTPRIVAQLSAGIVEAGGAVACAGVISTPGVAEVVLGLHAGAGVSVSASHNPWQDNGIKIFGPDARKWPDAEEEALERKILAEKGKGAPAPAPPVEADPALSELYLDRMATSVPVRLNGAHILVDAGNGAAFRLGPEALRRAGARVDPICDAPDGRNINEGCGALHPENMLGAMREKGAALGVAYDGDADRSIFCDENGKILDGDDVLWIIASDWKRKGILNPAGVVGTVMSNFALEAAFAREEIPFCRSAVGDRNVARLMEETGATLGGETSGHVLLPFSPAGDGILTTLLLASIVVESGQPLSRLATLQKTPQSLRNVRVARRVEIDDLPSVTLAVARAREQFDGRGRIFLRYSGTEPLLRILVEGPDAGEVVQIATDLEAAVRAELT
ncbi:MAG: phosphoglucosamine mutase [Acidobacteriota bacterium]